MVITGLTRNQVIPNGTEGSNPSLSAKNKGYSVCYTLYFFVDKTARDSNPYNLLQDEVLSKEVYNIKTGLYANHSATVHFLRSLVFRSGWRSTGTRGGL